MLYLDTSVLVAALTSEADSFRVQEWLATRTTSDLTISDWVVTEFSSALSRKLRMRELSPSGRVEALAVFRQALSSQLTVLPIGRAAFTTAARWIDRTELGLRAADALHAAVAAEHGATLCTLDQSLRNACSMLGVKTVGIGAKGD